MNAKDLAKNREKNIKDLRQSLEKKHVEMSRLYAEFKSGKDVNPKDLRKLKLDIAQISTIIREKELFEEKEVKKEKKEKSK